ncbi:MAG TPA: GMC family oxidoreductase, partial [Azospirillaceae bacterium]|nr:GMC family oxidoreductase [Azospirillaceae bacterium]
MLISAESIPADQEILADICIIGAGAAGITLALGLAGSALRVLVLEAGGEDFDAEVQDAYRGGQQGLAYHDLDVARLRYFGGSTNHWGGYCIPWQPLDFEVRPGIPLSGWP